MNLKTDELNKPHRWETAVTMQLLIHDHTFKIELLISTTPKNV